MFKKMLLSLGLCAALAAPAQAQSGLGDIVRMDVLDGGLARDGSHMAALRLTLSDGWKTYWRAPGDAGIPPQFSWAGSQNVGAVSFVWPTPSLFDQSGMTSIGYAKELVLPVRITPVTPGQPVHLQGQMEFGICKDVCVPGSLPINQALDSNAARHPAIAAAMAQRPYSQKEAGVRAATCRLSPTAGGLQLEAQITMPAAGGREFVVIEPGNPKIWALEAKTTRRGDTLVATSELVHVEKGSYALDRSKITITVLGRDHAVEILGCTPA